MSEGLKLLKKQGVAQGTMAGVSPLICLGETAGGPHEDHHVCSAPEVNKVKQES